MDGGGGGIGEPDRGGVGEVRGDEGFVCEDKGFLISVAVIVVPGCEGVGGPALAARFVGGGFDGDRGRVGNG